MRMLSKASAKKKKKKKKKAEGFNLLHFYWSFSSDIMAVTGLTNQPTNQTNNDDVADVQYYQRWTIFSLPSTSSVQQSKW